MRTSVRVAAYVVGVIVLVGVALGANRLLGADRERAAARESSAAAGGHAGHDAAGDPLPGGLQIVQGGYALSPVTTTLTPGRRQTLAFRIVGPDDKPVTQFTGDLHLIVVRRDLTGYQHPMPVMAADGTWSATFVPGAPGQYRMVADFTPRARSDNVVLGADLPAPGDYQPRELPAAAWETTVDGYTVTRAGDPRAGAESWMTVSVSKAGQPVILEPYLGAYGHLVALRRGDLAYVHLHPQEGAVAGPDVTFDARVPSAGVYRLFLGFKHDGTVHLAEFTATTSSAHGHN
ncbi:hypothetical protein BJY16_008367 [Actinoplanes octamycinicus]|uniref:Secreted protein n=1 Tax=Actinoplanes octamycinicus TaxID=135948 RepID=A0A7W7H6Q2_9ACTN|nr:hypothetical protein [Actinoplanes octamycinicus]MBB4744908.1 hypothetical protein [Actinoplanes octamycinicus]GIE55494.1 hypothetical protein Aoc01nite_08960 [Actinoplanes octamycinicus]